MISFFTSLDPEAYALSMPVWLDLAAVIVGSISGVLVACERKLDLVGGVGLAIVCGLGGGLIRDMIMQTGNVYMLESPFAIPFAVATGVVVFFFHGPFERIDGLIAWVDIVSVGLFAASGTDKAVVYELYPLSAILMGVITGVGGGMLRDVFLGDIPHIFRKGHLYALCAVSGSLVYYVAVSALSLSKPWAVAACVIVTVALRRWSLRYDIKSPGSVDLTPRIVGPMRRAHDTLREDSGRRHIREAWGGHRPDEDHVRDADDDEHQRDA